LNTIEADTVKEDLLLQSQSQAKELLSQQEELRERNEGLGRQAKLLAEQNIDAEKKNQEVEHSKRLVEEKAGQLTLSSKYKSEFIANMSHELRTPLNSLLILAQQLEDNPDKNMTETQVQYASVIRSSGNDLLSLLNSILELAKVESGTVAVERSQLSLEKLRAGLLGEFERVAHGKGLGYSVDIAADSPRVITTDPQRLQQILKNLLANAFKFTELGEIRVQIGVAESGWNRELEPLANAASVIAMSVSDTGIGIEVAQQQRIFEPFAQGDGSTARLYGGTGLGLSISRELAGLLRGELTVTSSPGKGSTFTVYLPVEALPVAAPGPVSVPVSTDFIASPARPREVPTASATAEEWLDLHPGVQSDRVSPEPMTESVFAGTRVLVVDDDFRNIFAMTALLERGHAIVTVAESGPDAIAILDDKPEIDIVLMDIMMPVMDGYATIRAIRAMESCKALPIIAVTGKVLAGERQRCLDAGANDYVSKPVDTGELMAAITPWLPELAAAVSPWMPTVAEPTP
jgi:two-component system chemotaxis sensor kinase CheA